MQTPLYTAHVNGHPVRYFRADDGGLPRHAFLDLLDAVALPEDAKLMFLRMVRNGQWKDDTQVIPTPTGPVVTAPHFMAQGFIGVLGELGMNNNPIDRAYTEGLTSACDVLMGDLPPQARFEAIISMGRKHLGVDQ
ncbi:hypothetical protein [Komagataeibacter oboediens]|uniref:hypothetical protein n=1 Tax=Komagataeibacter oboediens TaxID=65958 RepID=UPI001907D12F|nr:hypothetical protein [Komagataeibacter oboediens]GCE80642.1 hypothetical protein MSKU3_2117 [Komagataeibacter oboediens]